MKSHRFLIWFVVLLLLPQLSFGQDSKPPMAVVDADLGLKVAYPTTIWSVDDSAKDGSLSLQAIGHASRIEFRFVGNLSPAKSAAFSAAFRKSMESNGFAPVGKEKAVSYSGVKGSEVRFERRAEGKKFTLVVWEVRTKGSTRIIMGVFEESELKVYLKHFKSVLKGLKFGVVPTAATYKLDAGGGLAVVYPSAEWSEQPPQTPGAPVGLGSKLGDGTQIQFQAYPLKKGKSAANVFKDFRSVFAENLQKSKAKLSKTPAKAVFGGHKGSSYEFENEEKTFRIVAWEYSDGHTAWIILGVFKGADNQTSVARYKTILEDLEFSVSPK